MGKSLFIAEKPSVAQEFAKVLKVNGGRHDGYLENDTTIVTWCVGHLITMSYPDAYDPALKRWNLETLPFLPGEFKYEVISSVQKQFGIVSGLLNRADVDTIYVCTDSGREGEYIYRLVEQMANVQGKQRRRVWIDSQTEEEILKGIRNAKDLSAYDNLAASAYLRAKEDYLMGINFSRVLTILYGRQISDCLGRERTVVSVGRVMTCVLGMVVRREREIRAFVPMPFYRVIARIPIKDQSVEAEWRVQPESEHYGRPYLYKENGFKEREKAEEMIAKLQGMDAELLSLEKKTEKKNPPLLYNLAELQNDCSRFFKISPDDTLKVVQELYEKKMVTYPRTDARVLSSAVAKEIDKNIRGLTKLDFAEPFAQEILDKGSYKGIGKSRYTNDKQITDHYAIIPTGQGLAALSRLSSLQAAVYETIVRRFLSIFYPPAVYKKLQMEFAVGKEHFFAAFKVLEDPGYLTVARKNGDAKKDASQEDAKDTAKKESSREGEEKEPEEEVQADASLLTALSGLRKGTHFPVDEMSIREGETSPPKRYTSGTMILAMENAGQLIEDETLREQIKGSGIGTSATRAEILKKLVANDYLALNGKTQVITPTLLGEVIHDVVYSSIRSLLNPDLTASWEKGLTYVAEGSLTSDEYMVKLEDFIKRRVSAARQVHNGSYVRLYCDRARQFYVKGAEKETGKKKKAARAAKE
ncbi:MAG: type IA DNA topoisomerase [Lachnospiraceae bacterium]|nr:type IA DNA topoisomerase [Lachnospiraceae bacterium]